MVFLYVTKGDANLLAFRLSLIQTSLNGSGSLWDGWSWWEAMTSPSRFKSGQSVESSPGILGMDERRKESIPPHQSPWVSVCFTREDFCLHPLLSKMTVPTCFSTPLGQCSDWWTKTLPESLRVTVRTDVQRTTILDYRSHITGELWPSSSSAFLLFIDGLQEMEQFPVVASQSQHWISRLSLLVPGEEWEPVPLKISTVRQSSPVTACPLNESIILSTDDLRGASTALLWRHPGERSAASPAAWHCPAASLLSTPSLQQV